MQNCPTKNHPYPDKTFWLKFLDIHDLCNLGVTPQREDVIHYNSLAADQTPQDQRCQVLLQAASQSYHMLRRYKSKWAKTREYKTNRREKGIQIHVQSNCNHSWTSDQTATLTLFPDSHELQSQVLDPGEEANSAECSLICCWECSSAGGVVCSSELRARPKLRFLSLSPPPTHPPSHHIIISTNIWTSLRMLPFLDALASLDLK